MPKMVEDKKTRKLMNFVGVMSTAAVATHVVRLSADTPDAFKWGNVATNVVLGAALIKKGMDNM